MFALSARSEFLKVWCQGPPINRINQIPVKNADSLIPQSLLYQNL